MKTLFLLRHAKSSWDDPNLDDHDRPLSGRGRRAATLMGAYLHDRGIRPDLVLCSTARRTRETLRRVADGLGGDAPPIRYERALYLADSGRLLEAVRAAPDEALTLMVVGHNDGLPQLALRLAGAAEGDARERLLAKFPTGALATLTFDVPSWREVADGAGRLVAVVTPRHLA